MTDSSPSSKPSDNAAELDDFVQQMGDFFDQLGLSAIAGRLFAFLLVCDPPERSASDLMRAVGASAGSVNTVLRLLMGLGLVLRRGQRGSRQYLYWVPSEAWSTLMVQRMRVVGRLRELARLGLDRVGPEPGRRDRLEAMVDFYTFFEEEMTAVIERYVARLDGSETTP